MADAGSSQPPASAQSAPSNTTTAPSSQQPQQPSIKPDPTDADIDATIDEDITMNGDGTKVAAGPTEPKDTEMGNMGLPGADVNENPVAAAAAGATAPSKKDVNLREFLSKIDDYAPIIPDAVTAHYLTMAGLPPPGTGPDSTPPQLARLIALATQKFIADVAADAYQYSRIRSSNTAAGSNVMGNVGGLMPGQVGGAPGAGADLGKGKPGAATSHLGVQRAGYGGGGQGGSGQGRTVLTMEDLGMAVSEYGVNLKRGEFYR